MLSLRVLVFMSLALLALVCLLSVYTLAFKVLQRAGALYRLARGQFYRGGIEKALMDADLDEVVRALEPRRLGDGRIVEELLVGFARHLDGPAFERLQQAASRLGIVGKNIRRLRSPRRHVRGRAMNALGVLRVGAAVGDILAVLERERLDLQLVALRALAAIDDPAAIPYFLTAAERLPNAMLVRLASLMLEFGPPGAAGVHALVARHPASFPPRVLVEILRLSVDAGIAQA